jgi:transcriptional regulator with XRE-family HTH domain
MAKKIVCPQMRQIASNLIALRNKNCLTQQAVADELCIERKTYAAMENGQADIRLSLLIKLAKIYDAPLVSICKTEEPNVADMSEWPMRSLLESLLRELSARPHL